MLSEVWPLETRPPVHACYHRAHVTQDVARLLRASTVFASLPPQEIGTLVAVARVDRDRARDYVFMEGDPAHWLCVGKRGHVKILRTSHAGKDVVLELLGPGEIFGGVAVIERRPYPATAIGLSVGKLGMIDGVTIGDGRVHVRMTLTAPGWLLHDVMTKGVRAAIMARPGVERVDVELTFDLPWTADRIRA